jgi:hypothetical protein
MTGAGQPLVAIAEPDYQYGLGVLYLRIEKVDRANPVPYENEPWLWVEGMQVTAKGVEIGHRRVLVRARRLPPARR